eukprot:sb/3469640/
MSQYLYGYSFEESRLLKLWIPRMSKHTKIVSKYQSDRSYDLGVMRLGVPHVFFGPGVIIIALASAPGPKGGCGGRAPTLEIPSNSKNKRESTRNTSTHKRVKTCQCYYIRLQISGTFFLKHQKPRNLQWYVFKTIGCQVRGENFRPRVSRMTCLIRGNQPPSHVLHRFCNWYCVSTKFQLSTSSGTCFFKASKTSKSAMVLVNSSTGGFHALVCRSVACALSFVF